MRFAMESPNRRRRSVVLKAQICVIILVALLAVPGCKGKASRLKSSRRQLADATEPPKVALLFLVEHNIDNLGVWGQFFKLAGDLQVPASIPRPNPVDEERILKRMFPKIPQVVEYITADTPWGTDKGFDDNWKPRMTPADIAWNKEEALRLKAAEALEQARAKNRAVQRRRLIEEIEQDPGQQRLKREEELAQAASSARAAVNDTGVASRWGMEVVDSAASRSDLAASGSGNSAGDTGSSSSSSSGVNSGRSSGLGVHSGTAALRLLQQRGKVGQSGGGGGQGPSSMSTKTQQTGVAGEVEKEIDAWLAGKMYTQDQLTDIYKRQKLFSLYVHNLPYHTVQKGTIFYGRQIPLRVDTNLAYATHRLVQASLQLFRAALLDPLNQKFVMVSPNTIPLYHPAVMYSQLMGEGDHSRVSVGIYPIYKWAPWIWKLEALTDEYVKWEHYTKSSQWVVLNRAHAFLATRERHLEVLFQRHCYTSRNEFNKGVRFECVSDEIFFPTLLSAYGLTNETAVNSQNVQLWFEYWHAHEYTAKEVSIDKLPHFTQSDVMAECTSDLTKDSVLEMFKRWAQSGGQAIQPLPNPGPYPGLQMDDLGRFIQGQGAKLLSPECPLFARKFRASTTRAVLQMLFHCDGGGYGNACEHNKALLTESS